MKKLRIPILQSGFGDSDVPVVTLHPTLLQTRTGADVTLKPKTES